MAEPTLADLLAEMKTMAAEMMVLKADVASVKEKTVSSSSSGDGRPGGLHEQDFHPKHKKWDFPRFDGTTDPLLFINKCDAYFRQHRTPVEDRVAMASYHLDDVDSSGSSSCRRTTTRRTGLTSRISCTFGLAHPSAPRRCSSSLSAGVPTPSTTIPTGFKPSCPEQAASRRNSVFSYTPAVFFRP